MTAMYTIRVETSAEIDVTVELEIEADSEQEAVEMFQQEAKREIMQLPWGNAEINHTHIERVSADLIEVTNVEEYEDDEPEEDEDDD